MLGATAKHSVGSVPCWSMLVSSYECGLLSVELVRSLVGVHGSGSCLHCLCLSGEFFCPSSFAVQRKLAADCCGVADCRPYTAEAVSTRLVCKLPAGIMVEIKTPNPLVGTA